MSKHSRRRFLSNLTLGLAYSGCHLGAEGVTPQAQTPEAQTIPRRKLGSTGESVSIVGLGGYHIGKPADPSEATWLMHAAIEQGITFFDNCWSYHAGESERRMGAAIRDRRDQVFLMTKIDGRTRLAASQQIEQCLSRLQTDHVDLMQIREVIRPEDATQVFAEGGAIEALLEARQAGKVRYIGFTGHKSPAIHLAMLEAADQHEVRFDAVQLPLNVMDAHYDSFQKQVLPELRSRGIGVLGMKALGGGIVLDSGVVTARECLRYALSLPPDVLITGMESRETLQQAVEVASGFTPLTTAERQALLAKTASAGADGGFERFKTTQRFDGTVRNPHWLTSSEV